MKPQALRNAKPAHFPTLMFTGIAGSMAVIALYKYGIQPQLKRNRREEAEHYADILLSDAPPKIQAVSEFSQD